MKSISEIEAATAAFVKTIKDLAEAQSNKRHYENGLQTAVMRVGQADNAMKKAKSLLDEAVKI